MIETDVCIVGAGPGGAAAALQLAYQGTPCTLIDKATFPRDKICGDALSAKVSTVLDRIDPQIMKRLRQRSVHADIWGLVFGTPDSPDLRLNFEPKNPKRNLPAPGYVVKRIDFDNFLIEETKRHDSIDFHQGVAIDHYEKTEAGYLLSNKDKTFQVAARVLIVANGAHSAFTRHHAGIVKENAHYAGGIRAYYENVKFEDNRRAIELHYFKELTPGYLWIFPLANNGANIGLGMRSDKISERKFNMKKTLEKLIATHPRLKERFKDAEMVDGIKGYGLPLGSKKRVISGDHYMLVGDAGHLIDPLSGEGIGNAIFSGVIAADQAIKCIEEKNFSAKFMRAYDKRIRRVMGKELQISYTLQRLMFYPRVVKFIMRCVFNNTYIQNFLNDIYADPENEWHEQLKRPSFWYHFLFGKG